MLRELYARLEICSTIRTDLCHEYQKAAKGYEKLSLNEAAAAKFEGGAAGLRGAAQANIQAGGGEVSAPPPHLVLSPALPAALNPTRGHS